MKRHGILGLILIGTAAALGLESTSATPTPTPPTPVPFIQLCEAYSGPQVFCNHTQPWCNCTITSTLALQDGPDCIPCSLQGQLKCGSDIQLLPLAVECGHRYTAAYTCAGGPGFGCITNFAQTFICGSCQ